jgi:hypothetical protein
MPKPVQAVAFMVWNHRMFAALARRYGSSVIRVNLPHNSHAVVITDPALAKELFSTGTELVERAAWGAGSIGSAFGGRRSALPVTNTPSVASCWHRRFTASGCVAMTASSKRR